MKFEHLSSKIAKYAQQNPGKAAIKYGSETVTYGKLEEESNKLANFLHHKVKNLQPQYVLIMLDHSSELVISILAVLKCGLIYVPLDTTFPINRIKRLFKETKAQWLITSVKYRERFRRIIETENLKVLLIDKKANKWSSGDFKFENIYNKYCYIYFTSGSTGEPKGVLGRHRSLVHYIEWEIKELAINEDFNVSQLTNPAFDPFLRDIFVPLASGGTCCIPGSRDIVLDPERLIKWIDQNKITLIHIVPSLFKALSRVIRDANCLIDVKYILLAGELLRGNDIKRFVNIFQDRIQLVNLYGPTETTLAKFFYPIKKEDSNKPIIPVGKPIADTQVMILDQSRQKCLIQNVGEVYIRTPFISSGYFNDRQLTKKVFIKNPYSDNPHDIIYKTGDLGKINLEGNLELLGRVDSQVKVRGVRVELGEIEDLLLSYEGINDTVVLTHEDENGDKNLTAYLVAEREFTVNQLRKYLAKYLPENMIPLHFMGLERIPLTSNGKVDRKALLESESKDYRLKLDTTFVVPKTDTEKRVADAWKEVLNLDRVGVHDNFFDLGANSLHLIQVNSKLAEVLKKDIPVVALLAHPTVRLLSQYLDENEEEIEKKKKSRNRVENCSKKAGAGPVAVIGMVGRFPGVENIEAFWDNLKNGVELISHFSDHDLEESGIAPGLLKNPNYVKSKGFLENIEYFDASFFDYTPREAEIMDPQLRILHECVWEALENAGYDPEVYDGLIGLYIGAATNLFWMARFFTRQRSMSAVERFDIYSLNSINSYATRVSYKLNLKGPSISMQTACSTSLVSIHLACQALLNGECDMALAGGVCVSLPKKSGYYYQEGMIYSSDGHCRTFDARASGTVFGDGVGVVVLKPLKEAIADGDSIHTVIRGSAINNDGSRKVGYTAPSVEGQAGVIRQALEAANLEAESISYIETHGTGTALGDPIEIEALKKAFNIDQKGVCAIGSVKTNVGHLGAAAGAAGFIKTVMALKNKLIPPTLYFENPNPEIDFDNSPFFVNTKLTQWKNNKGPLRAGVSSFGIGGTNAHVILEEFSGERGGPVPLPDAHPSRKYQLILLSAPTGTALDSMTRNLANHFQDNPTINLADAAYTLQVGRRAFNHRRITVCSGIREAGKALSGPRTGNLYTSRMEEDKPSIVFMFPGLGPQYVNMGLELYQTEPDFREEMDRCFEILASITAYDIKEVLYPGQATGASGHRGINQFEIAQAVIITFEYALTRLLMKWGIKPDAMIGYSFGEYTAALVSGVFSLEDALKLVVTRGRLISKTPVGAMLSVPKTREEMVPLLEKNKELSIAIDNGSTCVVSGPPAVVESFAGQMKNKKILCMPVPASHAVHSNMMESILGEFKSELSRISLNKPKIPYMSNLTGNPIQPREAVDPGYWCAHLRQTVRFAEGLEKLLRSPDSLFLEVGPGQELSALLLRQMGKNRRQPVLNMVRHPEREESDVYFLLSKIGRLWLNGVRIDWEEFHRGEKRKRIPLPTYPFEGHRYWVKEGPPGKNTETLSLISSAGKNNNVAEWFYIPTWQRSIFSSRDGDEKSAPSILLVFANKGGLGDLLVNELVKEGHEVIMVSHGAKFGKVDDLRYTIHPQQREDYDMLLQDLCSTKKIPEKVVHMWNITDNRPREQESIEAVNEAQILGFYSLLYLAAAMGKQELEGECQITVITNNMQEVAGEEWLCPEKATLLGPIKVIPQEYANINCRSIDIVLPGEGSWQERKLVNMLLRELRTKITEPVMAYRGNHRLVQMFTPIQLDKLEGDVPRLRKRGVYLITGGLGGIGLTIAKYLVERVQAKLILVGRRALPARQEWARWLEEQEKDDEVSRRIRDVQELEALGGEIILGAADVSNFGQMQKIIADARERFGTINGVIHAAGLPGGGLIQRQTWEMTNPVLAPKVQGTLILDRLLRDVQLDFFILFSSRRSIIGLLGQVDYSAANAFLDAFAYDKASRDGTFCVAINWSSWADVGMASRNEEHLGKDLDISLQDGILPQEGIDAFTRVLGSDLIQVVVSTQDFVELVEQHKSLSASGLAKSLENLHLSRTEKVTCPRPRVSSSYIPPKNKMEHVLADIWKAFFGIDRIGIHDNFFELGATSLDIIHLGQKVKEATGMHIPIGTFFRFPRISELALHLSKKEEGKAAVKGVTRWDKIKTARKNLEKRVRVIRK